MIPLQGTPEWVAWRNGGVGASEMGVLLGEDPYKSEYELALLKRGEIEPEPMNEAMAWGHRVQRLALVAYAESTGQRVRNVNTTTVSKTHPHVYASLDGRVVGERKGVEVKLTRAWDEPPRRVVLQCQVQMAICDLDVIDVVRVGLGYQAPTVYPIERDESLGTALLELAEGWYLRYVVGDEMPPMDGSRGASRHLDKHRGEDEADATEYQAELLHKLHAARQTAATADEDERRIINLLKESMAGTGVLRAPGARVTWAPVKGRVTTDWKAVAAEVGYGPDVAERHTRAGEPTTRFAVKYNEEE